MTGVRKPSCADWVESNSRLTLTPIQRLAVEVLVEGMNTGPWNLTIKWSTVDWNYGAGVRFTMYSKGLWTFDFDHLARLVIAAHDRCVRLDIAPAAPRYFHIWVHPRERDGDMTRRHPTIKDAIARFLIECGWVHEASWADVATRP